MKSIVFFVALVAGCLAGPLTYEKKEKFFSFNKDCLTKSGVDEKIVQQVRQGTPTDDLKYKDYVFCLSQKFGFLNEAGKFQRDVIKNKLNEFSDNATIVDTVMERCIVEKATPVESAYYFFSCKYNIVRDEEPPFYIVNISETQKAKFVGFQKDCVAESGVNATLVEDAQREIFGEDPLFKKYAYCYAKKIGFQDKNGKVDREFFQGRLKELVENYSEIERLSTTCGAEKDTPENTALEFFKCFFRKSYANFLSGSS